MRPDPGPDLEDDRHAAVEVQEWVSADGRVVEFVDAGRGPALVLVHGTGGAWTFWRANLPMLSRTFRVIALSLPGCGGSSRLAEPPVDLVPYADAVVALMDHLDVPSATVAGHSLGGLVALRTALTHPSRVATLVLVDSGGAPLGRVRLAVVTRTLLAVRALCARPGFVDYVLARPRLRRRMIAGALVNPAAMTEDMFAEGLRSFGVPGVVDSIRAGTREQGGALVEWLAVPTVVVWGAAGPDPATAPGGAARRRHHRFHPRRGGRRGSRTDDRSAGDVRSDPERTASTRKESVA